MCRIPGAVCPAYCVLTDDRGAGMRCQPAGCLRPERQMPGCYGGGWLCRLCRVGRGYSTLPGFVDAHLPITGRRKLVKGGIRAG